MDSTVYSKIEPGTVVLGNDLWERQWSTFLGNALSLYSKPDAHEWVLPSPEFQIRADSGVYTHFELGYTDWSEMRDTFCAGLTARHRGDAFELEIEYRMFHAGPGMLTRMRLINVSGEAQQIRAMAMTAFRVPRARVKVLRGDFTRQSESLCEELPDSAVALLYPGGGLMLGIIGGGRYELFQPAPEHCALVCAEPRALAPGAWWTLPATILCPFAGGADAARNHQAAMLLLVREYEKWSLEREQDSAGTNDSPELN